MHGKYPLTSEHRYFSELTVLTWGDAVSPRFTGGYLAAIISIWSYGNFEDAVGHMVASIFKLFEHLHGIIGQKELHCAAIGYIFKRPAVGDFGFYKAKCTLLLRTSKEHISKILIPRRSAHMRLMRVHEVGKEKKRVLTCVVFHPGPAPTVDDINRLIAHARSVSSLLVNHTVLIVH